MIELRSKTPDASNPDSMTLQFRYTRAAATTSALADPTVAPNFTLEVTGEDGKTDPGTSTACDADDANWKFAGTAMRGSSLAARIVDGSKNESKFFILPHTDPGKKYTIVKSSGTTGTTGGDGTLTPDQLNAANAYNKRLAPLCYHAWQYTLGIPLVYPRGAAANGVTGISATGQDWTEILSPLSQAVAKYQANDGTLTVTGQGDDATMKKLGFRNTGANGWQPATARNAAFWSQKDIDELAQIQSEESSAQGGGRAGIVALARAQIGLVDEGDRGDGNKYGWQRVQNYYKSTIPKYGAEAGGCKAALQFANDPPGGGKTYQSDWSWCGIFAVYAPIVVMGGVSKATWNAKPDQGFAPMVSVNSAADLAQAQPGDVLAIHSTNSHHVLLAESPGDGNGVLVTVEGNIEAQEIRESRRFTLENIIGFYAPTGI